MKLSTSTVIAGLLLMSVGTCNPCEPCDPPAPNSSVSVAPPTALEPSARPSS